MDMRLLFVAGTAVAVFAVLATEAHCKPSVKGFYVGAGVGFGGISVSDKIAFKGTQISGIEQYTKTGPNDITIEGQAHYEKLIANGSANLPGGWKNTAESVASVYGEVQDKVLKLGGAFKTRKPDGTWSTVNLASGGFYTQDGNVYNTRAPVFLVFNDKEVCNTQLDSHSPLPGGATDETVYRFVNTDAAKILAVALVRYQQLPESTVKSTMLGDKYTAELTKPFQATVRAYKHNVTATLNVGYHRAYGSLYLGLELQGQFIPSKVIIQSLPITKSTEHHIDKHGFTYQEEVYPGQSGITFRTKGQVGAVPIIGVAVKNCMIFMMPSLNYTTYNLRIDPANTSTASLPEVSYAGDKAKGDPPYTLKDVKVIADGADPNEISTSPRRVQTNKGKFAFGIGVGTRFTLGNRSFVGVRFSYQPRSRYTQKVQSSLGGNDLHDLNRSGTEQQVSVRSYSAHLEFGRMF
jgi:hypothetical protein